MREKRVKRASQDGKKNFLITSLIGFVFCARLGRRMRLWTLTSTDRVLPSSLKTLFVPFARLVNPLIPTGGAFAVRKLLFWNLFFPLTRLSFCSFRVKLLYHYTIVFALLRFLFVGELLPSSTSFFSPLFSRFSYRSQRIHPETQEPRRSLWCFLSSFFIFSEKIFFYCFYWTIQCEVSRLTEVFFCSQPCLLLWARDGRQKQFLEAWKPVWLWPRSLALLVYAALRRLRFPFLSPAAGYVASFIHPMFESTRFVGILEPWAVLSQIHKPCNFVRKLRLPLRASSLN